MAWAALDDGFCDHPKVVAIGNEAAGLYARLISYCAKQLTDGVVPLEIARSFGGRNTRQLVAKLTANGLANEYETVLVLRDYLDYNKSRSEVEETRWKATNKKRAQRGLEPIPRPDFESMSPLLSLGLSPGTNLNVPGGQSAASPGVSPGTRAGASPPVPVPAPLPSPVLPQSSSAVKGPAAAGSALLEELAATVRWDPPKVAAARADESRAVAWMQASLTRDDVRNPGGWAWHGYRSGDWPSERKETDDMGKGQNLAGNEIDHGAVIDFCVGCEAEHPMSVLDQGNGFCPACVEKASGEAA